MCWEIVSNSNCDLDSQLGFLIEEGKINFGFLVVEGKTIPWCEGNLFFVKKVLYSQSKREQQKSLINRQCYKQFDGFGPRVLPIGREKIERETKKEKIDFHLGGTQKEGEYKVLLPSRRHKESMCKCKERGSRTRKKKMREQPRGSRLEKKKTAKRGLCVEKKIERRV